MIKAASITLAALLITIYKDVIMLVLSRKRLESIVIGDDIIVTVVDIRGDKVRIGIEAPNEVPVHRREVYDKIRDKNGLDENGEQ